MANILLVDDERSIRSLLRAVLEKDRHHIYEAPNGRLGLQVYGDSSVDLIITDLTMPEMDGLDMISELTRRFSNVKVIAMTGGLDSGTRLAAARLLGARLTLQKPFDLDAFLSAVRSELEH